MGHFSLSGIREWVRNTITFSGARTAVRLPESAKIGDRAVFMEAAMSFSLIDIKTCANSSIAELRGSKTLPVSCNGKELVRAIFPSQWSGSRIGRRLGREVPAAITRSFSQQCACRGRGLSGVRGTCRRLQCTWALTVGEWDGVCVHGRTQGRISHNGRSGTRPFFRSLHRIES